MATPQEWEAFHAKAIVSRSLEDEIAKSWHRSRFSGVHPEQPRVSFNDVSLEVESTTLPLVSMPAAGTKSHAAEGLRISRRCLYDKLHRHRLRF